MEGKPRLLTIGLGLLISVFSFALLFAMLYAAYLHGQDALFIALSILGGIFWGWVIYWLYHDGRMTFSHILTIWMVFTGTLLTAYSYLLANRQSSDTLSDLSKYIIIYVVSTPAGYFIKSGIENGIRYLRKKAATSKEAAEILENLSDPESPPIDTSEADESLHQISTIESESSETEVSEDAPP